MSDQDQDYLRTGNREFRLTADVTALMLKGAGYAAIFCFVSRPLHPQSPRVHGT